MSRCGRPGGDGRTGAAEEGRGVGDFGGGGAVVAEGEFGVTTDIGAGGTRFVAGAGGTRFVAGVGGDVPQACSVG
ncbi:hypothetical protein [Streptomyces sp. NPDC053728]|uniref:hypothetical protein n=1 Tax=Streptomyces sp. NPDC053728 TaxID=3155534 RepID=UPI003438AC60